MVRLIRTNTAGMVATQRADGRAAVSPKATFVVLDKETIAFGNIRSPQTMANLRRDPHLEVCFLDVLTRKAVRVGGTARIFHRRQAPTLLIQAFETVWSDYLDRMSAFVVVAIGYAELILSPAYDIGLSERDLRAHYRKKLGLNG